MTIRASRRPFDRDAGWTNARTDSLVRYLEHFCHLSSFSARNAKLEAVTLDSLTISTGGTSKKHLVPIQPPMSAWLEARTRFAALDAEAVAALDRSDITVKKFDGPRKGWEIAWFVYAVASSAAFWTRSNFQLGSVLYDSVLKQVPAFAHFCYNAQPLVWWIIVITHLAEATYIEQSRLQKHSVPRLGSLWWKWMINTLIDGFPSILRFNRIVEAEKEKKANAKH
ncbi:MAG: hypothetical protein Q9190_007650 [Brigantiaea leucoxantha]